MNDDQKIDDGPLMVHFNPEKLCDLATVSFAAALMHDTITKRRQDPKGNIDLYSMDFSGISLPPSIESTVRQLVTYDMTDARTQWWAYHHECVFLQRFPADAMIDWLDELVWLPEGMVNYRQTAKRLINSDKLTKVQKFQLACSYCFVEDVEYLKSTLTNAEMKQAIGGPPSLKDEILRYWNHRLKLEPLFYFFASDRARLFGRVISSFKHYDEWSFIEYFFNQLNNEERLLKANSIIDLDKANFTWNLLPLLTGPELDSIIREKSRQIIMTLVKNRRFFENSLLVWKRMIHSIDNDALADILFQVNNMNYERSYVNDLLWEMWLSTSELQKKFIVDERINDFVENPENDEDLFYRPNFPLIIDVLSRSCQERRYEYFTDYWPYLVIGQLHRRNFIDRIMKMCIGNDHQIEAFKNTVMINYDSISNDCEYLIKYGHIDRVLTYVDFCATDPLVNRDLKKMIVTKMSKGVIFRILFPRWGVPEEDFNRYIDDIFTEDESKQFFNEIVMYPNNLKKLRNSLTSRFQNVIEFVEKYVSSEENLLKVKLDFFQNCRVNNEIPSSVLFDLTAWCFKGDNTETKKLKTLLPRVSEVPDVKKPEPVSENPIFKTLMDSYLL